MNAELMELMYQKHKLVGGNREEFKSRWLDLKPPKSNWRVNLTDEAYAHFIRYKLAGESYDEYCVRLDYKQIMTREDLIKANLSKITQLKAEISRLEREMKDGTN